MPYHRPDGTGPGHRIALHHHDEAELSTLHHGEDTALSTPTNDDEPSITSRCGLGTETRETIGRAR